MPVERARKLLSEAGSVLIITGAGVSAESGIPTFRGEGGLWEGFRAEDLATPAAFEADPALVWRWYSWRRGLCNEAVVNPGHTAIATLQERIERSLLVTQNVDGLHRRAGSRLIELHGCIDQARCTRTGRVFDVAEGGWHEGVLLDPRSGEVARPHILWFGERYWPGTLDVAQGFASQGTDVVLVVGTSGTVGPPAALALHARRRGAVMIEVNPERGHLSAHADLWLQGPSGEVLPGLIA